MRYVVNPHAPVQSSARYNVLRHAGAIYAMAQHQEHRPETALLAALKRAAGYLVSCCIGPVPDHHGMEAVWTRPEITGRDRPVLAKLGGAGLALTALAATQRLAPDTERRDHLQALARFVLFMQKADGSFYSRYVPSSGGRQDEWVSLYYPGEAALGLLSLYDLDPRLDWLAGAAHALHYLARSRRDAVTAPPDHWALIATAKLLSLADDAPGLVDRPLLLRHAGQVSRGMLAEQETAAGAFPGAFTADGRTTPTATRVEGLLAVRDLFDTVDPALAVRIDEALRRAMTFLRRAIIRQGPLAGGVPRAMAPMPDDGTPEREAFNRRAGEIRIDYVQHTLSALLGHARHVQTSGHCDPGAAG